MAESPLISIITPAYNAASFLEPLIESVRRQTERRVEHIIIDDGSTDGDATVAVLRRYPHLRWWTRPNRGQYPTMNEGLAAATGEWVGFISADDIYATPAALRAVISHAEAHPDHDAIFGRWLLIDPAGRPLPVQARVSGRYPACAHPYLLHISHCALFVRRSFLVERSLTFREDLRYTGDGDWIFRLIASGARFGYVDRVLAGYRIHPGQTMARQRRAAIRAEQTAVYRAHGISTPVAEMVRLTLDWRSRFLRARYEMRQGGITALARATVTWLRSIRTPNEQAAGTGL